MKILITGGTGLIGQSLIDALIQKDHQVFVLTCNRIRAEDALPVEVIAATWYGSSLQGWDHIMDQTDAIINLAGESIAGNSLTSILTRRWTKKQKYRIKASRQYVGKALTEALMTTSRKPRILIQASASELTKTINCY